MTVVRPEGPSDLSAIRTVHVASFPTGAEARLVELLREGGNLVTSLVADVDGQVVGHVAFSPVRATEGSVGVGLAPLGVLPTHRRRGIAARLVESGLVVCRDAGYGWVVVLGDPRYYRRFGFAPAAQSGLEDEYGGGAAFQAVELTPGSLPSGAGVVRYAREFAQLEP